MNFKRSFEANPEWGRETNRKPHERSSIAENPALFRSKVSYAARMVDLKATIGISELLGEVRRYVEVWFRHYDWEYDCVTSGTSKWSTDLNQLA